MQSGCVIDRVDKIKGAHVQEIPKADIVTFLGGLQKWQTQFHMHSGYCYPSHNHAIYEAIPAQFADLNIRLLLAVQTHLSYLIEMQKHCFIFRVIHQFVQIFIGAIIRHRMPMS